MGRKTYQSLPELRRPLGDRVNIVVTRDLSFRAEGVLLARSIEEAIKIARTEDLGDIWIIGGSEIYKLALPFTDRIYVTEVDLEVDGDTFFPPFPEFTEIIPNENPADDGVHEENGIRFVYRTYARPSSNA